MEEKDVRELLNDEIISQFQKLDYYDPGSKEYDAAIDGLTEIYKLKIDQDAKDCESYDRAELQKEQLELQKEQFEFDKSYKKTQIFEQKVDRVVKVIIEISGPLLAFQFLSAWMDKGFEFEKNGTYTSPTFKWFFGRFKLPWFK